MYRLVKRIRRVWVPPTEADAANPSSDRLLGFLQAVEHPVLSVLFSCTYGAGTWFITYITYPPAMIYLFIGAWLHLPSVILGEVLTTIYRGPGNRGNTTSTLPASDNSASGSAFHHCWRTGRASRRHRLAS